MASYFSGKQRCSEQSNPPLPNHFALAERILQVILQPVAGHCLCHRCDRRKPSFTKRCLSAYITIPHPAQYFSKLPPT
jgi:hypothetical protein